MRYTLSPKITGGKLFQESVSVVVALLLLLWVCCMCGMRQNK